MSVINEEERRVLLKQEPTIFFSRQISVSQHEWRSDPLILAWTRQNGLVSGTDMEKWEKRIEEDPTIHMLGIYGENEAGIEIGIGTCGLTSISLIHGTAEFSLLIGPEFQRKGYGRAALSKLLQYGFKNLRLNCIWGETFEQNPALKLFVSLGMQVEGRVRKRYFKNGSYTDAFIVSILKEEAEAQPWWIT